MNNYFTHNLQWWFRATTKVTSMSGGNVCGCWVCQHQQAPTTILS